MAQWYVLNTPAALAVFAMALFFCLFDRVYKATHGLFTYLSAGLAIVGAGLLLFAGAPLQEAIALLLIFLLLQMGVKE